MYVLQLLAKTVPKGPNSEIIAYDKWHCGATDFEKPLSHQVAKNDCPKRMFEADLCCRVHDMCYMEEQKSREQCDEAFCYCLERTVAQNANQTTNGCAGVSTSFCEIVKIFGGIAYLSSQELRTKQQKAMAKFEEEEKQRKTMEMSSSTTPKPTTESTKPSTAQSKQHKQLQAAQASKPTNDTTPNASPTTSFPSAVHSTVSPAEIGQFVTHKFPLECFDNTLSFCTRQLHRCVSEQHSRRKSASSDGGSEDAFLLSVQLAECSSQFCACSSAESARARLASVPRPLLGGEQCAQSLAQICAQFEDEQGSKQYTGPTNVHYWSVSVNYSAFSANLGLVVTSVLLISLFLLLLVRLCPQIVISTIRKRIYRLSTCRHYDANGSTNYFPIGKESTASSPIGDAKRQQLQQHFRFPINRPAGRKNWHFNRLSNRTNDRTGISTPPLVLNSSQIRLHSSGNSSNTLSSEMSSSSSNTS
ncbi:hypothetical protein niasHT_025902 [Heterodera trifolii]|uniref:Uncharacterized protein n=1 Tax=Heterodera trifolii TaxID=157864 RepID=A0ABD2JUV1_9BILA